MRLNDIKTILFAGLLSCGIAATLVACSGLMCLPLSSMLIKMGMDPVMLMMAYITMKTLMISTKLIWLKNSNILFVFKFYLTSVRLFYCAEK